MFSWLVRNKLESTEYNSDKYNGKYGKTVIIILSVSLLLFGAGYFLRPVADIVDELYDSNESDDSDSSDSSESSEE